MKFGMTRSLLIFGGLLLALGSQAASLQQTHVPAEPAFVLHLDVDKIRPTAVGQYLLSELEKPEAQSKFAAFQAIFNFDPRRQLHGLTLYSRSMGKDDGVLIVYADVDPGRLTTLAKSAKEYQSATHKQHTIHSWIEEKKKAKDGVKPRTYAATYGSQAVVFAQQQTEVAQALDVLDGKAAALASTTFWPFGTGSDSGFIQAVARKLTLPDSDPNAAIFRLSKLMKFNLGEDRGNINGSLVMVTESDDVATNVAGIAKGLVSLLKLQKSKPEAMKLAEAMNLTQEAEKVVLSLSLPANEVVNMMKADAARKAAREAEAK
jgi:hypothetical protein